MKKRLISILCSLTLIIGMLPFGTIANAKAQYDTLQKSELVYALGITDSAEAQNITLKSFLKMMSRIYQDGDLDPVDFGVMMEMIEGDENPGANISVADAVKYAVITMGYRVVAESNGGDVNAYAKVAQDLEIADGISPTSEKNITYDEAIAIIFNMLDATPMIQKFITGTDSIYEVQDGETMLSYKMDVRKITGIVTADSLTSIYKADGCGEGRIEIDMNAYKATEGQDFSSYLGKKVEAYVGEDKNGDSVVLYMAGDKNEEITIEAGHIANVNLDGEYIEYYNEAKTSKKKLKLEYPPKVIYNDRFYSDYTEADLEPAIGSLRLIDNDNNNKYDVILVDSYKEMIVESRVMKDKTIYNKCLYEGALVAITLEGIIDREYKVFKGDQEISFGEIGVGNSLLVKESKDNIAVTILVSDESLEGQLKAVDTEEMILSIDGKEYSITDGLIAELKRKARDRIIGAGGEVPADSDLDYFNIGADYRFLFDAFGNVAYMEVIQDMNYYLYFKSYMDDIEADKALIVYMNMNNEWNIAPTAKKVEYLDAKCDGETLLTHLDGKKPQLVKMEFNAKGEVKKIELATDTDLYKEDVFTRTTQISGWYYSNQRTIDYNYFANYGAQVLDMPTGDEIYDKTLYKFNPVESRFKNDQRAICRAFDIDEYNFSSMFTMELSGDSLSSSLSSDYFLVTKKNSVVYDDEPAVELVGMVGRFSNFSYVVKDVTLAESVNKGDLVRYHVNEKGYIDYLTKVYSMEGTFSSVWNLPNGVAKLIAGTVELIDLDKNIIKLNCGGTMRTLMLIGTSSVMFYEQGSGDVRIGGTSELTRGSKVIINGNWHSLAAMYSIE